MVEPDEILTDELYTWDWVDARKLILPSEGPNRRRWTWMAEEIELTMDEAKDWPQFPASLRRDLVPNARVGQWEGSTPVAADLSGTMDADARDRFVYTEIWDRIHSRVLCMAAGQSWSDERFLLDEPYPDGIEDDPYALLAFLPIVGPEPSPWPMPYTWNWIPLQEEYNTVRRQLTNAAKRAARKIIYDQHTFPDSEQARKMLSSSIDMEAVEVLDLTRPPQLFQEPAANIDLTRSIQALQYDWRVITGAPGTRLSGSSDAKTATEASYTERAANLRDSDEQALVRTWMACAGQKMLQLVRQTLTLERYVRMRGYGEHEFQQTLGSPMFAQLMIQLYGPDLGPRMPELLPMFPALQERFRKQFGEERFLAVSREHLEFDADVDVLPASMAIRTLDSERQSWLQFLTVLNASPILVQSPALLRITASMFPFLDDDAIEELTLLGQRQQQAQQQMQEQQQSGAMPANARPPAVSPPGPGQAGPHGQLPPQMRGQA